MGIDPRRILYTDDHLLAVNKLSGELVVRGKGAVGKLPLLDFLRKQYPGLRAVHRLDFATSGVVIFARTRGVLQNILHTKFTQWEKVYWAVVKGVPRGGGVIQRALPVRRLRSAIKNAKLKMQNEKREKVIEDLVPAETRYKVVEMFGDASLVEATMVTGRHHQIRRHFAAIGHPLALDDIYGDQAFNRQFTREHGYHRFFLHAARLRFPHPVTGKILTIEAPLPRVFEECLERLRGKNSVGRTRSTDPRSPRVRGR